MMELFGMNLSQDLSFGTFCVAVVVLLVLTVFAYLAYSGLFHSVTITVKQPPLGQAVLAYKFSRGPYKESGKIFEEIVKLIGGKRSLGIYYDDPKEVPAQKCRYAVGAILSEDGSKIDANDAKILTENGFSSFTLPRVPVAVQATFPFVNLTSIYLSVWKVYGKMDKFIKCKKLSWAPAVEIYTCDTITFMIPQSRGGDFVVPEAKGDTDMKSKFKS